MQITDPTKSCIPRCRHGVLNVPGADGKNKVCSVCTPIEIPYGAKHVIARNEAGQFVNILKD
jgi:hypothetical protein